MALLDRRITIRWGTGDNAVSRTVWAEKRQDEVARETDLRGILGVGQRVYRIRYWPELVAAVSAGESITVVDPEGVDLTGQSVGEPEDAGRRRFLDVLIRGRTI